MILRQTKYQIFSKPLLFFICFFRQYRHTCYDQCSFFYYQCCLQISESAFRHRLRRCYSANILQYWVGGRGLISARWTIPEFPETFPGFESFSTIYVRYCRLNGVFSIEGWGICNKPWWISRCWYTWHCFIS